MATSQVQTKVPLVPEGLIRSLGLDLQEVQDPEQFISHLARYHRALGGPLPRRAYEQLCFELGITPSSDDELDPQQMSAGDFGGALYHVNPLNRIHAIARTLQQRRFWQLSLERSTSRRPM